jgi:type II secretory pathway predicted ATPase ExeA
LLRELEIDPPWNTTDSRRAVREAFLVQRHSESRVPVLAIDEAHSLKPAMLDELRMLTSFDVDATPVLSLVLTGHPELAKNLARKPNEALNQRIGLRYHITGMTWDETRSYITHQLQVAGVTRPIFTETAMRQIFHFSQGIPRKINTLAIRSLETAYLRKHETVDDSTVEMVTAEYI